MGEVVFKLYNGTSDRKVMGGLGFGFGLGCFVIGFSLGRIVSFVPKLTIIVMQL